ncbi:RagB/SusD family nutrient uptake outer membrane protein [Segatella buccae]|uniref:RagB/SusD family nutrient uptake outer membrane protein n=1 Tax=Segatella buccae TaxID=28126 RepID=UPI00248DF1EA|nr:RagB/SusD family nutrient uptake outer membrane protein [Segatella buccae]
MKKYKTFITVLMAGIGIMTATSCSDSFLDLAPKSNMNEKDFYKSASDFATARISAYATLYNEYGPASGMSYTEMLTDETEANEGKLLVGSNDGISTTDVYPFSTYSLEPSNTAVKHFWQMGYSDLNIINKTLDNLNASGDFANTTIGLQYKAELRFLRALYHFNLVRMFGDIPIVTHSMTIPESYKVMRSATDDVYKFIIDELKYSIENLPMKSAKTVSGQITKGAAETCLGEVYLTRGSKKEAAAILKSVIDSKKYSLVDNYADLWSLNRKNSEESILEIQYVAGAGKPSSPYFEYYAPFENFSITAQGYGLNQVTSILYKSYEENDPRREASIATSFIDRSGNKISTLFEKKWIDSTYIKNHSYYYDNNFIVYRYADVLLMYAEAANDAEYLNQVRTRVGLPGFGTPRFPSDKYPSLELAIEHERNVELALEFHRWFDLKRTGRATVIISSAKNKQITNDMLVLPIPQTEIQNNPALTQNNYYMNK